MKKAAFMIFLSFLFAGFIGAETLSLTLEDAVSMAISENLPLKQSGISLRKKERAKVTAWNSFLPSISASAGFSANHGVFSFEGNTPASWADPGQLGINAGLALSLPLNIGVGAGFKKLKADYEAGLLDYEAAIKSLEKDVQKQFYSILANQENIRIQQANIDLARKRYEQSRDNFESGLVRELDVLSAEVSLSKLQVTYNSTIQVYDSMVLQFKTILGADRNDVITLVGELPNEFYDLDAEELIDKYAAGRLDIRSLDKQIESLEYSRKAITRNANTPTLSLGYSYGLSGTNAEANQQGQAIDPWSNWGDQGTLSLNLHWKLDGFVPGSKTHVQVKDLKDSMEDLRLTREILWRAAGTEIVNLVGGLHTSRLTIEANTSSTELAKKSYELTEEAYKLGARQPLDVESAQNDYMAAQQQLLVAKYNYIAGLLDLEYALNTPMEQFLK